MTRRAGARFQPVPVRQTMSRAAGRRARATTMRLPHIELRLRRYLLPLLVIALAAFGGWWLYQSPMLSLRGVSVRGNSVLPADGLKQVAGLDGQSLFRPDFAAAEQRLEALPLVKEARVSRDLPFGAKITVVERTPWGVWQAGDQRYVIDDEGVVLGLPAPEGTPLITQADPGVAFSQGDHVDTGAIEVAKQLVATSQQTLGRSVEGLEFSQAVGLTVVLQGDLRVIFGDAQGYDFKLATLYALLEQAREQGNELHSVDLRFGNLVAVQ